MFIIDYIKGQVDLKLNKQQLNFNKDSMWTVNRQTN